MKQVLILIAIVITAYAQAEITVKLPSDFSFSEGGIYKGNEIVGNIAPKDVWPYSTGEEFISSWSEGFPDDPSTTKFISSGEKDGIYWVCRKVETWDGKGGAGIRYNLRFWVNGPILTMFSEKSCTEKFDESLRIASGIKEQ